MAKLCLFFLDIGTLPTSDSNNNAASTPHKKSSNDRKTILSGIILILYYIYLYIYIYLFISFFFPIFFKCYSIFIINLVHTSMSQIAVNKMKQLNNFITNYWRPYENFQNGIYIFFLNIFLF